MKKALFLLLSLLLAFLIACGGKEPDPTPDPPDVPEASYKDPTHQSGTYKVVFELAGGEMVVHYYEAGEMPEPPTPPDVDSPYATRVFYSWSKKIAPVTGDAVYKATYKNVMKEYTATFVLGDKTVSEVYRYGEMPEPEIPPDFEGMTFACWDREIDVSTQDVTYTAIYTDQMDVKAMETAYKTGDFIWQSHGYRDMQVACGLYGLVLQEHEHPMASYVRDRIVEQIEHLTASGSAPEFDCSTNWPYGIVCATLAMAKDTPSVWNAMSASTKARVDTMMEAFAYIVSLGTSDQNAYSTGPAFGGNYKNNWNVNYALGNIPCMVFAVYYFGDGDIDEGARIVNEKLKGFDEAEYDRMIRAFESYGWQNAKTCWTTPSPKAGYADAKQMLVYGGTVYGDNYRAPGTLTNCGTGKGVNNGGVDFTYTNNSAVIHSGEYKSIPLTQPERIVMAMIDHNYTWKTTSEHFYNGERVAWILDGTRSPYEGMLGMMYEFGLASRSAITYTGHDFDMIVPLMSAARVLKRCENGAKTNASIYDFTEDAERFSRIQVGNEDFIYKYRHGWQDFVKYTQGGLIRDEKHESGAGSGYWVCKGIWRTVMKPLGDLAIAESFG